MSSTVILPNGRDAPSLGLGTWHMGERIGDPAAEALALKRGLDLGATLIDTAEMYARGGAERVVADAIKGRQKFSCLQSITSQCQQTWHNKSL